MEGGFMTHLKHAALKNKENTNRFKNRIGIQTEPLNNRALLSLLTHMKSLKWINT